MFLSKSRRLGSVVPVRIAETFAAGMDIAALEA